jgi:hypothetical protein
MVYPINQKLLEEGKTELLKGTLNDLESVSKLKDTPITVNMMKKILEKYNLIRKIGPKMDLDEYDYYLLEIINSSGREHVFY